MHCPACGTENREEAKFCLQCGQRFARTCAACGAALPHEARFCDECGSAVTAARPVGAAPADSPAAYTPRHLAEQILTSRSALEGERKQVAVLFADVVGSTPLAETLDPEEMHGVMDRCFRILLEEVHRYEGTVNQFTGDGIMALFGAPIAHEDASERAVRSALGMQAALRQLGEDLRAERGIDFRMRIGIHTGLVVVGKIGDDLRMDYTAVGDTVNLASRLQNAAAASTVLVSAQTAKLIGNRFELAPTGPLVLKGKSRPVSAFEVLRPRPRPPLVAPTGQALTPLVGRGAELAALATLFERARGGAGQVAFVVGEAGIGKSRLLHELRTRLAAVDATWLEGRCISFGRGIPLLPVIDLVKYGFGIEESDDERAVIDKVHAGLAGFGAGAMGDAPYLRALLAVDPGDVAVVAMDASARRFATFDALKRMLLGFASRQPLILFIEDLHWIDPASDEFLTYVTDALATSPVLLICTHRPGYQPSLGERSFVSRVQLQPLTEEETKCMAAAMLDTAELPDEIRQLIGSKAEGNPFFVEEVTKSLTEIGALQLRDGAYVLARPPSEIVIPDTIQDVIMARIDRLGEDAKRAIQVASVIGREFALRLLQRASELGDRVHALVGELRTLELIYEKAGVPELAYMFKHALTHDVAYESLLVRHRRRLHAEIGAAIEDLYDDRLSEHWETLAHHFERAEDWPRAFAYLAKAADKALAAFANREALHFYERALEVVEHVPGAADQRAALLEGKGNALQQLSEFLAAEEAYRAALALRSDPHDQARIKVALSETLWYAHEFDESLRQSEEGGKLAETVGDLVLVGRAQLFRGDVFMVRGQLEESQSCFEESRRLAAQAKYPRLTNLAEAHAAMLISWRGEYARAMEVQTRTMAALRAANELFNVAIVNSHLGIAQGGAGLYCEGLATLDRGIAEAEAVGDKFWRARMWNTRGWILGELGEDEGAEEGNRRCIEIAAAMGSMRMTPELIGNAECNFADLSLARGDLAAAERHLGTVAAIIADPRNEWMSWRYTMHYNLTAADLAIARGDLARARRHAEACLATARRTRSRRYLVRSNRILASCHIAAGAFAEAERILREVVTAAESLGNPPQLWHALLEQGRALHGLGRSEESKAAWAAGQASLESVAARLSDELRSALHRAPITAALHEPLERRR